MSNVRINLYNCIVTCKKELFLIIKDKSENIKNNIGRKKSVKSNLLAALYPLINNEMFCCLHRQHGVCSLFSVD